MVSVTESNEEELELYSGRTCKATTESPGWATLTSAQVRSSLLCPSILIPTTTEFISLLIFFLLWNSGVEWVDLMMIKHEIYDEPNQTLLSTILHRNKQKKRQPFGIRWHVTCALLSCYFCGGLEYGCLLSHDDNTEENGRIDDERKNDFHVVHCGRFVGVVLSFSFWDIFEFCVVFFISIF